MRKIALMLALLSATALGGCAEEGGYAAGYGPYADYYAPAYGYGGGYYDPFYQTWGPTTFGFYGGFNSHRRWGGFRSNFRHGGHAWHGGSAFRGHRSGSHGSHAGGDHGGHHQSSGSRGDFSNRHH